MVGAVCGCGSVVVEDEPPVQGSPVACRNPYQTVVVTGRVVNLRQGPGTQYEIVGSAVSGDTLLVTGEAPDWYSIYVPEKSLFAWVYSGLTTEANLPGGGGIE